MDVATFAASRRERLTAGDEAIRPAVQEALTRRGNGESRWWAPVVTAASQIWLEHHQAEAPGANYVAAQQRFRESVSESLSKTSDRTNVERITRWASTLAVNAGTIAGSAAARVAYKMWVTMEDADVRDIHRPLDGQIVRMGSTFNVDGHRLPYPAVPVGPPEVWIECRCVAMPASREGEAMTMSTFTMGPDDTVEDDNPDIVVGNNITASADVEPGWASVMLIPAETDPIVAASSEPAHVTFVWMGNEGLDDFESVEQAVRLYAQDLDGPLVVPVTERGTLGEDDADVVFLEPTDSLLALRDGLMANEPIQMAHDAAEQFPEWTPHVTLGYPETPALAEYDGTEVTFDRIGLWVGDEHWDYPMGGTVSDTITADAAPQTGAVVEDDVEIDPDELVPDEPEDDEEIITEIPIHGVLAPEGVVTGDNRGFRNGALSARPMPLPYRYEYVSSHGGNNTSEVATVGRIDEAWLHEPTAMWRFRGVVILDKPYASAALEAIIDGSGKGVSIDADAMADDVEAYTEEYIAAAEAEGKSPTRWFKSARVAGLTQVPIPAFHEAYVDLGWDFEEDMDPEQIAASAAVLEDCGCGGAYRQYDADARKRMAGNGQALPDGSFPIADEEDLRNAIQSIGRASDPDAARAHIKKRARTLGKTNLIPQDWGAVTTDYANGGIVEGGKMALVGGDNPPESFIPLTVKVDRDTLEQIAFAPGTKDGPGWITHPVATARIRRYWTKGPGAAKIRWGVGAPGGDFDRCRRQLRKYVENPDWLAGLCANMHKEATGVWPGDRRNRGKRGSLIAAGGIPAPIMTLVAAGGTGESFRWPAAYFADPQFQGVTPLTIDKATRRVYGHLAQWKSCHIGVNGACQKPPRSASGYANFLKGVIDTDEGTVDVGTLTYGIGHANPMLRAAAATAHYDQTDAVFAFVNIGEDKHGIWYNGVLRASVTDEMIDDIRAIGALSGDWRRYPRFGLDLVAAVSVNTPGYSLAASAAMEWEGHGDLQNAALGLGIVEPEDEHAGETHEQFVARIADMAVARMRRQDRLESLHARTRALRLADARARAERI